MGMVDVTDKPEVQRQAEAVGKIHLSTTTIEEIKGKRIKKGNPLQVAEIAAMNAAKQTYLFIPHCHQIPLNMVGTDFRISNNSIEVRCLVRA